MIRWTCPSCAKTLKAKDSVAGKKTRCPQCAALVTIPAVEPNKAVATAPAQYDVELIPAPAGAMQPGLPLNSRGPPVPISVPPPPTTFRCPHCQAIQAIAQHFAGQFTNCSQCSLPLLLPVPRALPVENTPPAAPAPRVPVRTQPKGAFDFDDQREPMPVPKTSQDLIDQQIRKQASRGVVLAVCGVGVVCVIFLLAIFGAVIVHEVEKDKQAQANKKRAEDEQALRSTAAAANRIALATELKQRSRDEQLQEAIQAMEQGQISRDNMARSQGAAQDQKAEQDDKKRQADEKARRIGSLTRGERQQAQLALARVKAAGQEGFERLSPILIQRAAMIDPELIAEMQRKLGEQRAKMK